MIKGLGFSAIWKETFILFGITLFLLIVSLKILKYGCYSPPARMGEANLNENNKIFLQKEFRQIFRNKAILR